MDVHRWAGVLFGLLAFLVVGAVMSFFSPPSVTGKIPIYQPVPLFGGVQNEPDPHTQHLAIDEGACSLFRTRPITFLTWVDEQCRILNPGRQRREADCRYRAELVAETRCRPAPVFENIQPPGMVTGAIAVDPLGCSALAENYDAVVVQTLKGSLPQTTAMVNPCSGVAEVVTRNEFAASVPLRTYKRSMFASGDVAGDVVSRPESRGDVHYVRCASGSARVVVAGVPVCNTLG